MGDVREAAEKVRKAEEHLHEEREALYETMLRAYGEGIPVARIAREAQMSRQHVSDIVHRDIRPEE